MAANPKRKARGRPPKAEGQKSRWGVYLDAKFKPPFEALAARNHRTARQEIELALSNHLERDKPLPLKP